MTSGRKPDERWAKLRARGLKFTTAEANAAGLSPAVLTQAVARKQIRRLERGRYEFVAGYKPASERPAERQRGPTPLMVLELENFGVFEDARFEFCPGVNVLIGENGTGKSHAMLAAYSILRAFHKDSSPRGVAARVEEKLKGVFKPDDRRLGRLVRRARGGGTARISVESDGFSCEISFNHREPDSFELVNLRRRPTGSSIFIPSRELIAMYEGFIGAYESFNLSFSEVYYDTCVALNAPLSRGPRNTEVQTLLAPLLDALGGRVYEKNGRFYVRQGNAELEAHLVSEGLRKIATLVHLINNGSLERNDILFWDEPEANLNPALSKIVVHFLVELAKQGVQVVLATHDYSMTTRLSILAENEIVEPELIRFFSLAKVTSSKTSAVGVSHASTLAGLPANPILDEHEALYDFELRGGVA
jgi:energy-coupling factor transporter ATP-binding protein EcfA2